MMSRRDDRASAEIVHTLTGFETFDARAGGSCLDRTKIYMT